MIALPVKIGHDKLLLSERKAEPSGYSQSLTDGLMVERRWA